ncbi:hypothetical protein PIGHUM_01941 [Pigmentiphaga humi]|uniref:TfoX N-terminal domain-containing protein n=1 Tax=Pigmentiphaga humi TaxID=2478468 RepID=A0A3P4B2V3_9BURK|nr:hypothetical protein [Pigmentiphaga humi]VCU69876.1 hypothetical protein PIGHUM_01941 [Pigmentiphaga humi]
MPRRPATPFAPPHKQRQAARNALLWVFEPLERDPGYLCKRMFGCHAAYLDDVLYLVAADREEPWSGLLVCTARDQHAALVQALPALRPHAVLGKWLYLPQDDSAFESVAAALADLALARDPRMGVASSPRSRGGTRGS